MNNTVDKPIGLDSAIQKVQTYLYKNLGWDPLEVYGRIYKNPKGDGKVVPQHYKGKGEYLKDVFITDTNDNVGNIFFIIEDKHELVNARDFKVKSKIVFMLNLKKIFQDDDQRQDLLAHQTAWNLVKKKNQFKVTGLETGLATVLKGFDLSEVQNTDIEPLHVFALVGELKYSINNC